MKIKNIEEKHISVLLKELVNSINIFKDKKNIIVDATLWMWWHAIEIIKKMNSWDIFIWFDADERNLVLAKERLENKELNKNIEIILINSNFVNLKEELEKRWINKITWIYYDLWISSLHVDEADRWFSFKLEWPLDMRFDSTQWQTAENIINYYTKDDLIRIFREYWEEPSSRKIAEKIVEIRKNHKIKTTKELSDIIWKVSKFPKSKNRIFQAIRIETNNELENISVSVKDAIDLLEINWCIFIISFHSLEDRIIKNILRKESKICVCKDLICSCEKKSLLKIMTKKPIIPTEEEILSNPRSRSAKARLAIKKPLS